MRVLLVPPSWMLPAGPWGWQCWDGPCLKEEEGWADVLGQG